MTPPNLAYDLDAPLRDFWRKRLDSHQQDSYKGRVLAKMPEDLRTYQHLIEGSRPEVIVELGAFAGGSAIWFADQLDAFGCRTGPVSVISVDLRLVRYDDERIVALEGLLESPAIQAQVHELVAGRRAMVSEDSAHLFDTTMAALNGYSDLVPKGGWFVVEDGVVDDEELRLPNYSRGVQPAIEAFLASAPGQRFARRWIAPYGITTDIGGWLECVSS